MSDELIVAVLATATALYYYIKYMIQLEINKDLEQFIRLQKHGIINPFEENKDNGAEK